MTITHSPARLAAAVFTAAVMTTGGLTIADAHAPAQAATVQAVKAAGYGNATTYRYATKLGAKPHSYTQTVDIGPVKATTDFTGTKAGKGGFTVSETRNVKRYLNVSRAWASMFGYRGKLYVVVKGKVVISPYRHSRTVAKWAAHRVGGRVVTVSVR